MKYHRADGFNNRKFFLIVMEARSPRSWCRQGGFHCEASSLGWWQPTFACVPLLHVLQTGESSLLSPSFYENTNPIMGPHSMAPLKPSYLPRALTNTITLCVCGQEVVGFNIQSGEGDKDMQSTSTGLLSGFHIFQSSAGALLTGL